MTCFGIVCLCWAWRSSRASGFPRALKAMPVKGLHHVLFWYCVLVLSLAVLSSLRFPVCPEGDARKRLASCLVLVLCFVLDLAVLSSLNFPACREGKARQHLRASASGAIVSIIGGIVSIISFFPLLIITIGRITIIGMSIIYLLVILYYYLFTYYCLFPYWHFLLLWFRSTPQVAGWASSHYIPLY